MDKIVEVLFNQKYNYCELLSSKLISEDNIKYLYEVRYTDLIGDYRSGEICVYKCFL